MSTHPSYDTSPGPNPVDGDPDFVDAAAGYYRRIAEAIADSITSLSKVVNLNNQSSEAFDEFRALAQETLDRIREIDDRYTVVAQQLSIYAGNFREARRDAQQAIQRISGASDTIDSLAWKISHYSQLLDDPSQPPANRPSYQRLLDQAQQEYENLGWTIGRWYDDIDAAVLDRGRAADRAAAAIRECIEGSPLNDSFWDDFTQFVGQMVDLWLDYVEFVLEAIGGLETLLDILSIVVTVLAVIALLTGVGAAFAPALFALGRILNIASLAVKATKLVLTAVLATAGRRSWGEVGMAAVNLAFAVGAKFGAEHVGKLAGRLPWVQSQVAGAALDANNSPFFSAGMRAYAQVNNAASQIDNLLPGGLSSGLGAFGPQAISGAMAQAGEEAVGGLTEMAAGQAWDFLTDGLPGSDEGGSSAADVSGSVDVLEFMADPVGATTPCAPVGAGAGGGGV